jgi:hypothetical protein
MTEKLEDRALIIALIGLALSLIAVAVLGYMAWTSVLPLTVRVNVSKSVNVKAKLSVQNTC